MISTLISKQDVSLRVTSSLKKQKRVRAAKKVAPTKCMMYGSSSSTPSAVLTPSQVAVKAPELSFLDLNVSPEELYPPATLTTGFVERDDTSNESERPTISTGERMIPLKSG